MAQEDISILIIDDDPDQLELISRYLQISPELQCRPEGVRTGHEALARLSSRGYDVVLLDYKMPGMDGLEVLAEITKREFDVPVIMVTGMGDERIAVKALKQGTYDYITKAGDYSATLPYIIKNTLERYSLRKSQNALTKKLLESEEKYRTLFEYSPIPLWEEDFSEARRHINRLQISGISDFRSFFEAHPDEVIHCIELIRLLNANKAALHLCHANSPADLKLALSSTIDQMPSPVFAEMLIANAESKSGSEYETIIQTLNGDRKTIILRWIASPGNNENTCKVLVSVKDITHIKTMERQRDNFISMVAHDMKSGLVTIQWLGNRLQKKIFDIEKRKQEEYIEVIRKAANRLEYLVNDLLEFSMLQREKLDLSFTSVLLDKELEELYESYQARAQQQEIVLELCKVSPLPLIEADANRLNRVFTNLLDNALKYSSGQGVVTVSAWQEDNYINIRITDEGIGIDPADLPYIFDPFHRGKKSGKFSGLGVGLATVKTIVEGHRGWVFVESELGKGSAFTIVLPVTRES